ncbi:MAG TPA: zinc ribbon domain-containing protein [Candidatus Bathyarchaeia archaeon]|nr:zinc ribbon domain-containing protein [Candidatus Bathyarchaeia archaeon]
MSDKPTAAMVLSLIGGIFVIIGGAFIAFVGSLIGSLNIAGASSASNTALALGVVGIIMGLIMIVGAFMMYSKPTSTKMWGVIVLILSIVSWVTAVGGLFIGFLLGLIGGILALTFKPTMAPGAMPPPMMSSSMPMGSAPMGSMGMTCKNCGASIPAGATRCPSCGANL